MENSLFWLVAACCLCLHSGLSHSASSCTETIWMRRLNRDISLFLWYRYNYCLILNTAGDVGFGSIVFKLNPSSNLIVESEPFSTLDSHVRLIGPICEKYWFLSLIEIYCQLIQYWCLAGMLVDPFYNPKASVFDNLRIRLKNLLFLKIGPLSQKQFNVRDSVWICLAAAKTLKLPDCFARHRLKSVRRGERFDLKSFVRSL